MPSGADYPSTAIDRLEKKTNKGQPNGYASLDASGHIPHSQLVNTTTSADPTSGIQPATTVVSETTNGQVPGVGTLTTYSREDHTHGTPVAPPGNVPSSTVASETTYGVTPAAGAATTYSRGDHTHGTPATPPAAATTVVGSTSFGQSSAVGALATYSREDHVHGTPTAPTIPAAAGTVVTETAFGQSSTAGAAATFSRGDHTHGSPTAPVIPAASATVASETTYGIAANAGAAATFSKGDHTHGSPATPPAASGTVAAETSFGIAAAAGVATTYSKGDHTHGSPTAPVIPAAATTVVTETASAQASAVGTATTYSREDHTHGTPTIPAAAGTVVSETAFGQSTVVGVAATFSRGDHSHGSPTAPVIPAAAGTVVSETAFGQSTVVGVATTFSRGDHSHGSPTAPVIPAASGTVASETTYGIAAAAGAAATFSRGDHTHGSPTAPVIPVAATTVASETTYGIAASAGAAATFSKGDHTHGSPTATAGGSLAGTYPNPTLAAGVATGAVLGTDVLATSATNQTKTGTLTVPLLDHSGAVFNVRAYGAVGDGSTDDTVAIQAAIDAAKAVHARGGGGAGAIVFIPHGTWVISSLNLTGIGGGATAGFIFKGAGVSNTRLMPNTGAVHVLDCTGSANMVLRDFMIGYNPATTPQKTGILMAQTAGLPANAMVVQNVLLYLKCTVACFYNYGVPSSTILHGAFLNNATTAQPTVWFSASNAAAVTSTFATVTTGTWPTSDWTFVGCEIHDFSNNGNGTALKLDGTSSLRFFGGNISAFNTGNTTVAYVLLVGATDSLLFEGTTFYSDGGFGALMAFQQSTGGVCTSLTVDACAVQAAQAIFGGTGTFNTLRYFGKVSSTSVVGNGNVLTLVDPDLTCDGSQINISTATITRGILHNPGVITSGTNTAVMINSAGGITLTGNSTMTGALSGISTLTATTLAGTLSTAAQPNVTSIGPLTAPLIAARYKAAGTALVAADFVASAAWGSTASVSVATGSTDQKGSVTVTAGGTGITSLPTIVLTWKNGTWTSTPTVLALFTGGTGFTSPLTAIAISPTTTACTFQWFFTPTTGLTYTLSWIAMGGPT